jgi:hypothetical protein
MPLSGFLIALLAVTHSMIDFSLQIPGFAIVVAAIVGGGLAQSFRTVRSQNPVAKSAGLPSGAPAASADKG